MAEAPESEIKLEKSSSAPANLDAEELKGKLERLAEIDRFAPVLIASRAVLRVIPLLAIKKSGFDHFLGEHNKSEASSEALDKRIRVLVDTIYAASLVCERLLEPKSVEHEVSDKSASVDYVADAAAAATTDASIASALNVAEYRVAYEVANAVSEVADFAHSAGAAYKAVNSAAFNVARSFGGEEYMGRFIINQLNQDISQIATKETLSKLASQPLWSDQNPIPKALKHHYEGDFIPSVKQLIKENPDSEAALSAVLKNYERYLNGSGAESAKDYRARTSSKPETERNSEDHLNRTKLVESLAEILSDKQNHAHNTIGLLGHWGAGKTRVVDLLKAQLNETEKETKQTFLYGEFNAWEYEHAKSIQAAMAHEVLKSLSRVQLEYGGGIWRFFVSKSIGLWLRLRLLVSFSCLKHPWKTVLFLISLLTSIYLMFFDEWLVKYLLVHINQPYQIGGGIAVALLFLISLGKQLRLILAQPFSKEFLTYIKLPDYASHLGEVSEMKQDIRLMAKLRLRFTTAESPRCCGKKRRLLFVVDDLDRCNPEGIVKTFEAIRLVLDIPQVTVLIAVDQRIAMAAMALHYQSIEKYHQLNNAKAIARDYLGKMIHMPIVLPEPDKESVHGYLDHVWDGEKNGDWRNLLPDQNTQAPAQPSDMESPLTETHADEQNMQGKVNQRKGDSSEGIDFSAEIINIRKRWDKKKPGVKTEVGLSPEQKAALAHWTKEFGLTNPRQLKRLDKSYNLLRLIENKQSERDDKKSSTGADRQPVSVGTDIPLAFPFLMGMCALEFANSRECRKEGEYFLDLLFGLDVDGRLEKLASDRAKKDELQKIAELIQKVRRVVHQATKERKPGISDDEHLREQEKFLTKIQNFVLPAIE